MVAEVVASGVHVYLLGREVGMMADKDWRETRRRLLAHSKCSTPGSIGEDRYTNTCLEFADAIKAAYIAGLSDCAEQVCAKDEVMIQERIEILASGAEEP